MRSATAVIPLEYLFVSKELKMRSRWYALLLLRPLA
jgi:hypothetical protein